MEDSGETPRPRNVLALDTCFESCSAAVGIDMGGPGERIVARFEPMATGQAERIMPMIAELIAEAQVDMGAIDLVAVTHGPGSFTGTRIGIAAAKGLAVGAGARLGALSSLNVIARQVALAQPRGGDLCIAVDMGREEIYAQVFDPEGVVARTPPELVSIRQIEQFAAHFGARVVARGPHFPQNVAIPVNIQLPNAETLVVLVTQCRAKLLSGLPVYLRQPDAKPPRADLPRAGLSGKRG